MRAVEKRLRERIQHLEQEIVELESDRAVFRNHFSSRFRWWIELLGKQEKPSLEWLIESDAQVLRNAKWWSW